MARKLKENLPFLEWNSVSKMKAKLSQRQHLEIAGQIAFIIIMVVIQQQSQQNTIHQIITLQPKQSGIHSSLASTL